MLFQEQLAVIRGAGDLASGVALRLRRAGFPVVMLELPEPLVVRRTVAFGEAVRAEVVRVEGITGCHVGDPREARLTAYGGDVAVMVDPDGADLARLRPSVLVDARMAKRPLDTTRTQARFVVGLGPGFVAGEHVHAVVETMRGHDLGRVLWEGSAQPDSGIPETVAGRGRERVLRAPHAGRLRPRVSIGDWVAAGDPVALIEGEQQSEVTAPFDGLLRGLIAEGVMVRAGTKIGDLDPRRNVDVYRVSDKALAIGGGVVEAVLLWLSRDRYGEESGT